MAFALKTGVEPAADLGLPLRVVLSGSPAEVFGEFQTVFDREQVNGSFQFSHAHMSNYGEPIDYFKKDFQGRILTRPPDRGVHAASAPAIHKVFALANSSL